MKRTIIALMTLALMMSAVAASADVAYQPAIGFNDTANDQGGNPIANGTYAMVLDIDGDGWQGNPYVGQSAGMVNDFGWLWDPQDILMDRGQIADGFAFPSYNYTGDPTSTIPGYNAGVDNWYLLWFATPYLELAAGPGAGIWYGAELMGQAAPNGFTLTPDALGGNAMFQTVGAGMPVPEPISCVLGLIGGGAMFLRRRLVGNA